jgi:hypothetical protein
VGSARLPTGRRSGDALRCLERAPPKPLKRFFRPLLTAMGNWREEIFAYFDHRYTNATAEALNGLIKIVNRTGRGYNRTLRAKMLLSKGVQRIRQVPMPNYGWGRDLMGMGIVRTRNLARTFLQFPGYFTKAPTNPFLQIKPESPYLAVLGYPYFWQGYRSILILWQDSASGTQRVMLKLALISG